MSTPLTGPNPSSFSQAQGQLTLILSQIAGEIRKIATAAKLLAEQGLSDIDPSWLPKKEYMISSPEGLEEDDPDKLAQRQAEKKGIKKGK